MADASWIIVWDLYNLRVWSSSFLSFHKDFVFPPDLTPQARKSAFYLGHKIRVVPQVKIRQHCKLSKDDGVWCRIPYLSFMCVQCQISFLQVTLVHGDTASASMLEQGEPYFMSDAPNRKGTWVDYSSLFFHPCISTLTDTYFFL